MRVLMTQSLCLILETGRRVLHTPSLEARKL